MSYYTRFIVYLECDFGPHAHPEGQAEFSSNVSRDDCLRLARAAGWRTYPAQVKAKCPACVKELIKC